MLISQKILSQYAQTIRQLSDAASEQMRLLLSEFDHIEDLTYVERVAVLQTAHALATSYGEGAAAESCRMYDDIAEMSGVYVAPAEMAETATFDEVAKSVNGTRKTGNVDTCANSVGRLVKMTGCDTMLRNCIRDGAYTAWIPQGQETCAFCIMLAGRGWMKASKDMIKNGHAEHIHPNCDCIYAVSFDTSTRYEGYDPSAYKRIYDDAEGANWKEKLNDMRRNGWTDAI